jgi:hypothetical protein
MLDEGPTLDEYIAMLEDLRRLHGGSIRVQKWLPSRGRHGAPDPQIAYKRVYDARRLCEVKAPQFYSPADNPVQQGEAVIRV